MNLDAMRLFLSKENIDQHISNMRFYEAKISILEKSAPRIKGLTLTELNNLRIDREIKKEAVLLKKYVVAHRLYFDSFRENIGKCPRIREIYGSREKFIYDVFTLAKSKDTGYVFICVDKRNLPMIIYSADLSESYPACTPVLCLDICEHAYFADYRFEREKYIKNALAYFNLNALESKLT